MTSVPNQNVNWSRGGSSSQWFETYVQSIFHTLKTKLFCRFSLFLFASRNLCSNAQLFFFFNRYTSPKFHWSRSSANFIHVL